MQRPGRRPAPARVDTPHVNVRCSGVLAECCPLASRPPPCLARMLALPRRARQPSGSLFGCAAGLAGEPSSCGRGKACDAAGRRRCAPPKMAAPCCPGRHPWGCSHALSALYFCRRWWWGGPCASLRQKRKPGRPTYRLLYLGPLVPLATLAPSWSAILVQRPQRLQFTPNASTEPRARQGGPSCWAALRSSVALGAPAPPACPRLSCAD